MVARGNSVLDQPPVGVGVAWGGSTGAHLGPPGGRPCYAPSDMAITEFDPNGARLGSLSLPTKRRPGR
jgi:hypothetical protein